MIEAAAETQSAAPQPLEYLREPAVVLNRRGEILAANAAAGGLLGPEVVSSNLFDRIISPRDELDGFLRRAGGSTAPLLGAVRMRVGGEPARVRIDCARLPGPGEARLIMLLHPPQDDPFSLLDRRVRELDAQLRARTEENRALQEALRNNRVLLAELQHRVKNNIQLMASLITLSSKDAATPEVERVVADARLRLEAMSCTQEAVYLSERAGSVSARAFLPALAQSIGRSFGVAHRIHVDVADVELPSDDAHALALIANELMTNAVKYGLQEDDRTVSMVFGRSEKGYELTVRDHGPGMAPEAQARSSGLRLVRGLCRQLRGALEIETGGGTRCLVRFGARRGSAAEAER